MGVSLTRFRVIGLHNQRSFDIEIKENKLVLVGENGTGKSTVATLIYYFLTRQWARLREIQFDALQAILNGVEVTVTPELIERYLEYTDRTHMAGRRFPPPLRNFLLDAVKEHRYAELLEDRTFIHKASQDFGFSPSLMREYLIRFTSEITTEAPELQNLSETIASSVADQVLFLPTYRRIEQDLKAIFRGVEADIEKLRDRLITGRTSSRFLELVEFGMADVEATIKSRMDQVKESVRTGLNNLTGTYLRDVIKGDYVDVNFAALKELDPSTLNSIFARIDEETLPRFYKQGLIEKVAEITATSGVGTQEAVIAHFLLKLFDLYKLQQASEKDVRDFVRVCNRYLTGKQVVYDDSKYQMYIRQLDFHLRDQGDSERLPLRVLPSQGEPDRLPLKALSSGEKQIVSLFSHHLPHVLPSSSNRALAGKMSS